MSETEYFKPYLEEKTLKDIGTYDFIIPKYQRPYKWRKEHVIQLLDDLYERNKIQFTEQEV